MSEKRTYTILHKTILNESHFEHRCSRGSWFKAARCDFKGGVDIFTTTETGEMALLLDVAEMIGWHATNILPSLNGFAGYDCIQFRIHRN